MLNTFNPQMHVYDPRTAEPLYLSAIEIQRFLHSAQILFADEPIFYALCALMAATGIRVTEAVSLKFKDVMIGGFDNTPYIRVRTLKQFNRHTGENKIVHRNIPIPVWVKQILIENTNWCEDAIYQNTYVFKSHRDPDNHIHRSYAQRQAKKAMVASGIPTSAKRCTLKGLRHGLGMHNNETNAMSHYQLQDIMGHANPMTTKIYTTPTLLMQARLMERITTDFNPKNNKDTTP
jgi:integrase